MTRRFIPGNRGQENRAEYEKGQAIQMCGRLEEKIEQLRERQYEHLGRGEENRADTIAYAKDGYQRLLECAVMRRDNPERIPPNTSRNPVLERMQRPTDYIWVETFMVAE